MRQRDGMTVRDLVEVVGTYRVKLKDYPESHFVKAFRRALREEVRSKVSANFSSFKAIVATAIQEEERMGVSVPGSDGGSGSAGQEERVGGGAAGKAGAGMKDGEMDKLIGAMDKLQVVLAQSLTASSRPKGTVRCHACNEEGHIELFCPR